MKPPAPPAAPRPPSSLPSYPPKWKARIENLAVRFPSVEPVKIIAAMHRNRGHAGKVARELSPKVATMGRAHKFLHPVEVSGRFLFSSAIEKNKKVTCNEVIEGAKRLKKLRTKLGEHYFCLTAESRSKSVLVQWKLSVQDDNDYLEDEIEIERHCLSRAYSKVIACSAPDILHAKPLVSNRVDCWKDYKKEYETLQGWFGRTVGFMTHWNMKGDEGVGEYGSCRYKAALGGKRLVVHWTVTRH